MPYIGRNHVAGDHTSNFKVLDDISSYTATFDGSATAVVSTADETIRIPEHRFIQGQRVTYSNGGGSNIGGLTNGTAYYVTFDTHNTIKLATSLSNANNNTNINLTSVGGGASHTLTAAFDGVNQKFKLTHSDGSDVNINNSTQVSIAINNVIQKPNNDAAFTEGFRVIHNEQIEFKVAPTSDNVFWGTVIANTIETFDISDLKIDNFTGDGTTTEFVLSREVPNNQSLMVSLDGVLQHPSDQNTSRSYVVVSPNNIIQFTAAPGLGVEIQVRHLGFAGASTGTVSGFYGRTGNVVLGSGDHVTVGNINATGIITTSHFNVGNNIKLGNAGVITATSFSGSGAGLTGIDATSIKDSGGNVKVQAQASGAVYTGIHTFTTLNSTTGTFSGAIDANGDLDVDGHTNLDNVSIAGVATVASNLHVGGVLTYEDVTNVDSVGLITARNGINVSGGNIKVGTGVTIEPNGQATFTGIVTFGSSSTTIDGDANTIKVGTALTLGHTQGLQFHTQNLHSQGFEINQINASGIITATTLNVTGNITGAGDLTLTDTTADSAAGPEFKLFRNSASPADADYLGQIKFAGESDTGVERNYAKITGKILDASNGTEDGIIEFAHIKAGSQTITGRFRSDSLQLLNGTNFSVAGTSEFSEIATFTKSGSAVRLNDGSILRLGNVDSDFFIYHDGSSTDYISAGAGKQLRLTTDDFIIKGANNTETLMTAAKDGAVSLYHNNTLRLTTFDNSPFVGVSVVHDVVLNSSGDSAYRWAVGGNASSNFKWSMFYSNSSSSLNIFDNVNSRNMASFKETGAIELNYQASKKLETTSSGVTVTGTVTATSFSGSGANLTGIEAFVTGMIILWSGAANAIPSGFVLCNGSNGTPDLRGRFVVGYHDGNGDYDVGDTGGSETVTLSTSQIPSHSHTTNNHSHNASVSDPGHGHSVSISDPGHKHNTSVDGAKLFPGNGGAHVPYGGAGGYPGTHFNMSNANTGISANASNANTSISVSIGNQNPTTNTEGGGGAHENRPPFYALCYIMKT